MDTKSSIVESLGGNTEEILPYLPYLLKDLIEIGTDPNEVSQLIQKFFKKPELLKILDMGCGKGAVSVRLAKEFGCKVVGIDALPDFIETAKKFALEMSVDHLCSFELGDMRELYSNYKNFNLVVLGAIGPIFGDIGKSLEKVAQCIKTNGHVLLDDAYIADGSNLKDSNYINQSCFYKKINKAGFTIASEVIMSLDNMKKVNEIIFKSIEKRANELIKLHPTKSQLFKDYLDEQRIENKALENDLTCGVWLLKKQAD
ncbi:MAG: class I SAM-dependent methyltransferase [Bacteroidales bacterium]